MYACKRNVICKVVCIQTGSYLQCDVRLRPIFHILKLDIRISVDEVDADQLLTTLALKARRTLTYCSPQFVVTGSAVLTLGHLAGCLLKICHLAKLATEESKYVRYVCCKGQISFKKIETHLKCVSVSVVY